MTRTALNSWLHDRREFARASDRARTASRDVFDRADELAAALRPRVSGEVRFDAGSIGAYATDASNYRQPPIGVVVPRTIDDVVAAVAVCREFGAPILARGGGTSLAGQCTNAGVVIDMSKYLRAIEWIDPDRRLAGVEPGCVLDDLRDRAEEHALTFGPDPATHDHCVIGGMIGNNACGAHAQMAGRTSENIHALEILTYDGLRMRVGETSDTELEAIIAEGGRRGQIYRGLRDLRDRYADAIRTRFPDIPRRVSGYCLEFLLPEYGFNVARALVGTESTCVLWLRAECNLMPSPQHRALVVLGYPDVYAAGDAVPQVLEFEPIALEGLDDLLIDHMRRKGLHTADLPLLPEGRGWLMVQLGADSREEVDDQARRLIERLGDGEGAPSIKLLDDPHEAARLWAVRESGLGATARVPMQADAWPGWEDSAVPPDRVGAYLRDLQALFDDHGYSAALYGHFGNGCIHCRVDFDLQSADGIANWRRFLDRAADLVVSYGGSLSGEHGDGQARGELLEKMYGPELVQAFREFKAIWDPQGKMNPGKVVDPYPVDANLRIGTDFLPAQPTTHFAFPDDDGSLSRASLRCVGVGKCRRQGGGTMCPSYMVTHEEEHSTRGRARLLFEMLQGDVVDDGWRSDAVKDSLDLCLACKACKNECPVNVDMATYKAEFFSHYYAGRLRPVQAYSIGLIYWWARLAGHAPRLVNLLTQTPALAAVVKRIGGVAPQRPIPTFSPQPFTSWFRRRGDRGTGAPDVLLWPDTFSNYFGAEHAKATVEVLEAAGFHVVIPDRPLCCGRPLYDYGMLPTAKRLWRQTLTELRPHIAAGTPLVGIEPSCLAAFRDELANLFPQHADAQRLAKQSFTLAEFLTQRAAHFTIPRLSRTAVVHAHCHHQSVMHLHAERQILDQLGLDYEVIDSGCCGLAGSFGFEAGEKYDVSIRAGERVLAPAVRDADDATLIITDGFSCQTQIAHTTDRRALHLAEVIALALQAQRGADVDAELDRRTHAGDRGAPSRRTPVALAAAGAALAAGGMAVRRRRSG